MKLLTSRRRACRRTFKVAALLPASLLSIAAAPAPVMAAAEEADRFYCQERKLGTWFYCTKPKPPPKADVAPTVPAPTATEQLDAVTAELRELKARAILHPTPENVTAYIRFQRAQLDRASLFGDVWQRAVWQSPDLDYTLERPVGTVAKRQWLDVRKAERDMALSRLGQRYGLFYFFAQSCGACRVMSPIVKSVADTHRITVRAISTDGGPSEVFRNYVVETNQRERMGLTDRVTPAVVLFDSVTRKPIPIGYGIIAADELMDRIFLLTQRKAGSDY
jgi:conjugal transfer pilus assembly protein TraF